MESLSGLDIVERSNFSALFIGEDDVAVFREDDVESFDGLMSLEMTTFPNSQKRKPTIPNL